MEFAPSSCRLPRLDPLRLGWAAGFFDGEGSTIAHAPERNRPYVRLQVVVPQHGGASPPEVLHRFREAVLGLGEIDGPDDNGMYFWKTEAFEDSQAVVGMMWSFLGNVKRAQAARAIRRVVDGYRNGILTGRKRRKRWPPHPTHALGESHPFTADDAERAWAAGFMDAEGCFGLARSRARKRGPAWYRLRVSASQHGEVGRPADVLRRLHAAFGGVGRIERHGDPDDFKWLAEGEAVIQHVLDRTAPWLGAVKLAQAAMSVERFKRQTRLKGDATRCPRGHEYTSVLTPSGDQRKICRPCDRINSGTRRAARGIPARQFRDVSRRYNF